MPWCKSRITSLSLAALSAALLSAPALAPAAQVSINIGAAPLCPYGYFDYAPYSCAPYGFYGPDWFNGGIFIGAGPWFRGPRGFYGHVDNRYDPHYGYRGPYPDRGEQPFNHFHGNEGRDGYGHVGDPHHDVGVEHNPEARGGFHGGGHQGGGRR